MQRLVSNYLYIVIGVREDVHTHDRSNEGVVFSKLDLRRLGECVLSVSSTSLEVRYVCDINLASLTLCMHVLYYII